MRNIIILGPQGSGKSTQAKFLSQRLGLPILEVGGMLRQKAQEDTQLGRKVKEAVQKGELVPGQTTFLLLKEELAGPQYSQGVVIDGAPRTLEQARLLGGLLNIEKVFYVYVPDEICVGRLLKRGRADDTPELIKTRLSLYHQNTQPALEYYKRKGILEEVDGTKTPDEVFSKILKKMGEA